MPWAPSFWTEDGILGRLLSPASFPVRALTARRMARPGWRAPVPVVCAGNAGVGGAGKTTLALDLAARLRRRGLTPHFLTRGHGGRLAGPVQVDLARHTAREVGDEALLLAASAPTWVGADRAGTARHAVAAGAQVLVMDDGLQNPTLAKSVSLLVIDGADGFGNGRVLPAGPLREPVPAAAARCAAAVLIGPDLSGARALLPSDLPVLHGHLVPGPELARLGGSPVLAFAGIGRPTKFFDMLSASGVQLVHAVAFPDHHRFTPAELAGLADRANRVGARLATTPKDHVRLDADWQGRVVRVGVELHWADEDALHALLDRVLAG